jgi:hypothetical protein
MNRKYLNFDELSKEDQEFFIEDSWCDSCEAADLGIVEPKIYIENDEEFLEGKCKVCGELQTTTVVIKELKGQPPKW